MSWPDPAQTSQFSMLLRVGTGKQNEDPLSFVRLGKTGWSTVHNVTKNRRTGLSSLALGQSDLVFKFFY